MTRKEAMEVLNMVEAHGLAAKAKQMAINALQTSTNKWIDVNERLPERDVDVLAYVRGASFDYQRVMWIDDYSGKWMGYIGSGLYDKVIAWMPLPEPYMCKNEEVIEDV